MTILFDDKIEIYYNFTNKQLPDGAPDECCRVSSNELKALIYKDCKEKTVTLRKVRIVTVWCGRQELNPSSNRGNPLFIRVIAFEHHNAHQKFLEIK